MNYTATAACRKEIGRIICYVTVFLAVIAKKKTRYMVNYLGTVP